MSKARLELGSTDDLAHFTETWREETMLDADYLDNTAEALRLALVKELQRRGMDHRGLLGSDANRAAKSVSEPLKYAASCLVQAAQALTKAWGNYNKNIATPIAQAENTRESFKV